MSNNLTENAKIIKTSRRKQENLCDSGLGKYFFRQGIKDLSHKRKRINWTWSQVKTFILQKTLRKLKGKVQTGRKYL